MRGRSTARAAALGALVGLAACDGYRLVEPGSGVAYFHASVEVTHDDSARYVVRAWFQRPASGAALRLRDEAIAVDGVRVDPGGTNLAGLTWYEWRETRAESDPRTGTLTVRGPELADGSAAVLSLPLVARDPTSPAAPAPGEDLRLRVVATAPSGTIERRDERWTLDMRDACLPGSSTPVFYLSTTGPVPPEVRIPRSLLPDPLPSPLEACLSVFDNHTVTGAPYPTFASTSARLVWRVAP